MKRDWSLRRTSVGLLLTATVALLLVPSARAQSHFKTLHAFKNSVGGRRILGSLVFDSAGNLYGTTFAGGNAGFCANGCGLAFKLTPSGGGKWQESVVYRFCSQANCADGAAPATSLIFDTLGNLYGTTTEGGTKGGGTVFKLAPNKDGTWSESVLYNFLTSSSDGFSPQGSLVIDHSSNLYGTTVNGGNFRRGTAFELVPGKDGSWTENVLYHFCSVTGCPDGDTPLSGVVLDVVGNLYGTTWAGGSGNYGYGGTVFELVANHDGSWTEKVLYSFCSLPGCNDGTEPTEAVIFDQKGNLYGTTWGEGAGNVFELTPGNGGGWTETVLYQPGQGLESIPALDAGGNLYGTALQGGPCNCGFVFELKALGRQETTLHNFFDHPGASPSGRLFFDAAGNLYGTTAGDGYTTFGSVFEITP